MIENLAYDSEELYSEIKERARTEGALTQEAWNDIVEEVLDEHLRVGEFDEDEDLVDLITGLKERFSDFEPEIR